MYGMQSVATQSTELMRAPKLRLLPKGGSPASRVDVERPALRLLDGPKPDQRPVLLAGGDRDARASVLRDLAVTMPPNTIFEQAGAVWEVLVRAPESSMVILSGELEEIPAESLMQMLVHRSPEVPVVCLNAEEPQDLGRSSSARTVQAVAQ
jgi:hypothetical protein